MTPVIFHFSWAFTLLYLIAHQLYCQSFRPPQIASLGTKLRCDGVIWVQSYVVMVQFALINTVNREFSHRW